MSYFKRLKKMTTNINGVSTPLFGVSWQASGSDRKIATTIILFMEDRRVLYSSSETHDAARGVASILEIRQFLTRQIEQLDEDGQLLTLLREMRAACREFLTTIKGPEQFEPAMFNPALDKLREVFRLCLGSIASSCRIDVPADFARFLQQP